MKITFSLREAGELLYNHMKTLSVEMGGYHITELDIEGYGHNQSLVITLKKESASSDVLTTESGE